MESSKLAWRRLSSAGFALFDNLAAPIDPRDLELDLSSGMAKFQLPILVNR